MSNRRFALLPSLLLALPLACTAAACSSDPPDRDEDSGIIIETDGGIGPQDSGEIEEDAAVIEDAGHQDAGQDAGDDDASQPAEDAGACLDECAAGETTGCLIFDVEVTSTWPADGAAGVPVTTAVAVNFNQGMFPNSLKALGDPTVTKDYNVTLSRKDTGTPVAVVKNDSTDKTSFIYRPNSPLDPQTEYQMVIRGGGCTNGTNEAVRSQNDTKMREDYVFTFTTGDAEAQPEEVKVLSITPANGAQNVSNTTDVVVTFNQPIQTATLFPVPEGQGASPKTQGTFWLSDSASYLFPEAGTLTFAEDMKSATFRLKAPLKGGRTYYAGVKGCADLANPANGKCVRGLSGGRMGDDFGSSFVVAAAAEGSISELISTALALPSDSDKAPVNTRITGALMTYYRDVKDNEGFFIQREETVDGVKKQVGIYVNTLGKAPLIPVWPMYHKEGSGWVGDDIVPVPEEEWESFAGYPTINLNVSELGVLKGMPYISTDGFPDMARVGDAEDDLTVRNVLSSGIVPVFSRAKLQAMTDAGETELYKKLLVTDEHLGTLVLLDGMIGCVDTCNHQDSPENVWLDLRWGIPNESTGTLIDSIHKIRVLLSQEQMGLLGIQKISGTAQKHVRILAPVQKRTFSKEPLLYVKPYKISSIECDAQDVCTAVSRTAAELDAAPELVRDIALVKDSE